VSEISNQKGCKNWVRRTIK